MARTPTDPTKAQVWITKGLDDLDFEFYFPQGPKGDPGGIVNGSLLGTQDLNIILNDGVYRQDAHANATSARNYPVTFGGVLVVMQMQGYLLFQEYTPIMGEATGVPVFYRREYVAGTWRPWRSYSSSRVDQTAGRAIYQWDSLNSRDQLVYGDTGWRDVSSSLVNGASGTLQVRRVGYEVIVKGFNIILPNPTNYGFYTFPSGFIGDDKLFIGRENMVSGLIAAFQMGSVLSCMTGLSGGTVNNTDHRYGFTESSFTASEWPTTLPGTAVGSIPNL